MSEKIILVVDDDPSVIQILSNLLRPKFRVKVATRGAQAIGIAASPPQPDLILLDVLMPDMDGYEVCDKLKNFPDTSRIPVIFVTGNASPEEKQRGLELGGVSYLTKPLDPEEVLSKIKAIIG